MTTATTRENRELKRKVAELEQTEIFRAATTFFVTPFASWRRRLKAAASYSTATWEIFMATPAIISASALA